MEKAERVVSDEEGCASRSTHQDEMQADKKTTPQDADKTGDVENHSTEGAIYSSFSKRTKVFILMMATFSSVFSPLSTTIYLPALTPLADDLGVSNTLINLTLTTYMIFQALSPTFFGDFADTSGRRPAYITTFGVYLAANIGLALQNSYPALLVLRCLQSTGSSATIAITMGVMADIATVSERGRYVGMVLTGTLAGPALGPVLGGVLVQFLGWRSTFWFLFKRIARSLGLPVDRKRAQSIKEFPIERARISLIFPFLYAGMAAMMAYGWALDRKVMLAGPLILQFVAGFCIGSSFTAMSTLLVDLYPSNPSAVTAASNLTRCMLGAGATASFSPLIERIGVGWCFTVWCLLTVGFSPGLWAVIRWGPGWREERRQRVAMVTTS
ncbi:Aqr1p [Microsporum canis CBS 113480]|uniref:Aqr1p n=1 Tax=Arthroderma otae (strain ATCC MYA-4605 / CBS 113480) TaxID=554155 RepID=C5FVD2_ARTOC|nr:Aqr1p [Microsporum canis CBS 113480]EEQ33866.1 Aqr1p [Microsporum canis CBS 113480]